MKFWVAIAIALFGVIVIADVEDRDFPSMSDMKGPAAPTVVTLRTIREDDQESHIAYIDSPLDPADGAVALPEKVNGPLGAKKWIEDMSQNPLYKAPPPVVPTPTKRVEVDPILMPHVVPRDIRKSVNQSILAFAKALGKPASKHRAPSAQLRNELLKLETATENNAPDAIIQKLQMNVAAAEQSMNAKADLLKSTALQAKSNLTQAEAALDAAMATANASVELNNWLRSARANHEDDKANVLMPEIDIVNERQKALFEQLVAAEKNATAIMYNAIKAAIKNRRLNETPGEVVEVLSGDKWVSPEAVKKKNSTNATKVQPNATNATD